MIIALKKITCLSACLNGVSRNDQRLPPWKRSWSYDVSKSICTSFPRNWFPNKPSDKGFDDSGIVTSGKVLSLIGQMHTSAQVHKHKNKCAKTNHVHKCKIKCIQAQEQMRTTHTSAQYTQEQMYTSATKVPCGFPQLTQTYQSWSALPLL